MINEKIKTLRLCYMAEDYCALFEEINRGDCYLIIYY